MRIAELPLCIPVSPILDEADLLRQLCARNTGAMAILYDQYAATLYGVILKIVKCENLAEDTLQESFMKIWTMIDQYDAGKGRLFTWMINICRHQAIDKIRSRAYRNGLKTRDIMEVTEQGGCNRSEAHTNHIGIKECVGKLSPAQQLLVDMIYFEGYTHAEAAASMGLPLGTIKTRIRKALAMLSKLLQ